jgi:hypothetical protein
MTQQMIRCGRVASLVWGVLAVIAGVFMGGGSAWAEEVPGLQGSLTQSAFVGEGAGYGQVGVTVVNSGAQARVVLIEASSTDGVAGRRYVKRILVSPGSTARVTMPVPRWFGNSMVRLRCEGVEFSSTVVRSNTDNQPGCVRLTTDAKAAMDGVIRFQAWNEAQAGWGGYYGSGAARTRYSQVTAPVASWPAEGAEYFGLPALIITAAEWDGAPAGVRKALMDYVAFGGLLGVIGEVKAPAPEMLKPISGEIADLEVLDMRPVPAQVEVGGSSSTPPPGAPLGGGRVERMVAQSNRGYAYGYGLFYVLPVVGAEKEKAADLRGGAAGDGGGAGGEAGGETVVDAGPVAAGSMSTSTSTSSRGKVRVARSVARVGPSGGGAAAGTATPGGPGDMVPARQAAHWFEFVRDCERLAGSDVISPRYNYGYYGAYGAGGNDKWRGVLKVEHSEGLSRNVMFLMLLLFSVAVVGGIVTLRVMGRKMWILVAMPSLSVACAAGLVFLTMLSEGFAGVSNVVAVTHLDQRTQEARTLGLVGIYSPLGLGSSGLRLEGETQIMNAPGESAQDGCAVDMTEDGHVEDGWVTPRVVGYLHLAKLSKRKERLVFARTGGGYSVTNGLGGPIKRLNYRDKAGECYWAENVAPGATAVMTRENIELGADAKRLGPEGLARAQTQVTSQWLRSYWLQTTRVAGSPGLFWPGAGEYVCELTESPFLEDGMKGSGRKTGRGVVLGIAEDRDAR